MAFIFDTPVSPIKIEELLGGRFVGRETGDEVNGFAAFFTGFEIFGMTFDTGSLSTEREIHIIIQIDRGPDFYNFQATMRFFIDFMLRGKPLV